MKELTLFRSSYAPSEMYTLYAEKTDSEKPHFCTRSYGVFMDAS